MSKTNVLLSVVAVLAAYLCESIGQRWCTKRMRLWAWKRAGKREWSGGTRAASAILPEIERLRRAGLSGARTHARQTPAHRWLIATTRQLVARLAFFRNGGQKNSDPASRDAQRHLA